MELILLAAVAFGVWYFLWPRSQQGQSGAGATPAAAAPVVTRHSTASPTADEAIAALTVIRDRLELVGAPPEKIQAVLALAPDLLAKGK